MAMRRHGTPARFELCDAERHLVDEAVSTRLGLRGTAGVLARSPLLTAEICHASFRALRQTVLGDNALLTLLNGERVRRTVPGAALSAGWENPTTFLDALMSRLTPAMRVLELGCGDGRVSRHVAGHVSGLVCTDVSRLMVAEARRNLAHFHNVQYRVTDGLTLREFGDASFDLVFAQGVLTFTDPNRTLVLLDETRRLLRGDGVCVYNFATIDDPEEGRQHLQRVLRQARRGRLTGGLAYGYTLDQLSAMYRAAGLHLLDRSRGGHGESRLTLTAALDLVVGQQATPSA